MKHTFNLIDEPWIPCVRPDGQRVLLGLRDLLLQAADLKEIQDSSPLVTVALHRTLLAILYGTQEIPGQSAWETLWRDGWNQKSIDSHLQKYHERFDLFSPSHPFYQRADFPAAPTSKEAAPIAKLAPELASGNNKNLFDHSRDEYPVSVSFAEAARLLVAAQAWALGGGKSGGGRPNFRHAALIGGNCALPLGANLRETLLLNLVPLSQLTKSPRGFGGKPGTPAWERNGAPQVESRRSSGIADYLTWQYRYVRLIPNDDGTVSTCVYAQGEALDNGGSTLIDPLHAYRPAKSDQKLLSVAARRDKASWRDADSLLCTVEEKDVPQQAAASIFFYRLCCQEDIHEKGKQVPIAIVGLVNDQAAVLRWSSSRFHVPADLIADERSFRDFKSRLEKAEEVARVLRWSVTAYASRYLFEDVPTGPDGKVSLDKQQSENVKQFADQLRREDAYWSAAETAFYRHLAQGLAGWEKDLRSAAVMAFEASLSACDKTGRRWRALNNANAVFYGTLNKTLPTLKERIHAA